MKCQLFYCKCDACKRTVGLDWLLPIIKKRDKAIKRMMRKKHVPSTK